MALKITGRPNPSLTYEKKGLEETTLTVIGGFVDFDSS